MNTDNAHLDLATRLYQARKWAGLSQQDAAASLGIFRSVISAIESGKRKVSALEAVRLANLYGCTISWLLDFEPSDSDSVSIGGLGGSDRLLVRRFIQFLACGQHSEERTGDG